MTVPYTFAASSGSIPLSYLDSNFATTITMGNTAVQLGDTITTFNNVTLASPTITAPTMSAVTISSGNATVTSLTATTVTASGNVQMASANGGQLAGLRNKIINGDMRIAQRGTSGALTTSYAYLSVDRFAGTQATAANGVLAQVAAGLDGFQYAAKIGRTATSTNIGAISMRSALETINSVSLQGQQVTFSFYAKAGANFSATSSNITAQIFTGTGTDQSVSTMNTWTGSANPINTATAITTTWTRYSFTATLSSTATQVGITVFYTPVGTAGADDNLYITGVQLEVGPIPTIFEQIPIGLSLQLCQRYYELVAYPSFYVPSTAATAMYTPVFFKVTKRVAPTSIVLPSSTNAGFNAAGATITPTTWTTNSSSVDSLSISIGNASLGGHQSSSLTVSSEL